MPRRLLSWLLVWLALAAPALAQSNGSLLGFNVGAPPGTSSYAGPADVVTSGTAFYSCSIAYNAAYALAGSNACNIRRASDNATQDIAVGSSGFFSISAYNSFVGTDASCTGSMVGTTTLTISACSSGTLHVNDPISGAGIAQPAFITAIGTCASPPGTCTVNVAQTFASEAVTAQVAGYATELYDQSGSAFNKSQSTAAQQAQLIPNCLNGQPCLYSGSAVNVVYTGGSNYSGTLPYTVSFVGERTGQTTTEGDLLNYGGSSTGFRNSANLVFIANNGSFTAAANDNAWHSVQGVYTTIGTGTYAINVDGSATTGSQSVFSDTTAFNSVWNNSGRTSTNFLAWIGVWSSAFTPTQYNAMCHNDNLLFGKWAC